MLVYDLANPAELQGFVRGILQEEERNRFSLSQFLPNQDLVDIEYRITRGDTTDVDAAVFRTYDTESPIGKRKGLSQLIGELPPMSQKMRLGEEERIRLEALRNNNQDAVAQRLIERTYDDAATLTRALAARIEMARGEALVTGQLVIDENGVQQTIDFERNSDMEPASPSTLWNDPSATIIQDLQAWVQAYLDLNGVRPAVAVISQAILSNILLNDEIRTLASSLVGAPSVVSQAQLTQVLGAFGLPPFQTYDVSVRVAGVATRVTPSDRLLLMPPASEKIGNTLFGTTAEAMELVGARQISGDQAPGLTAVTMKDFNPVATWTNVSAIVLPVLGNPDLVLSVDVQ